MKVPVSRNLVEPVLPFDLLHSRPGETKVQSLRRQLREAIVVGRLAAGTHLPSSRALAEQLGLARNTVTAAFDLLLAEGYVSVSPGARRVVVDLQRRRPRPSGRSPDVRNAGDRLLAARWRESFVDDLPRLPLPERSFIIGVPEARGFPHAAWRQLLARTLRQQQVSAFGYAPPAGLETLRAAIARHVAFARALACTPEQIVVTAGAQQAFDLLARLLTTEGQTCVAVEDPGYPPLRAAFMAAGARIGPVPVDDEGVCVDRIPAAARVVAVTPSHQAPTGVAMSARRRLALLDFARRADAVVIEDDYDGEFRYSRRPLDALKTLDVEDRVVYVGTFSKSVFPALRIGYVVAPDWLRPALLQLRHIADSHPPPHVQSALAAFIDEGHLARHVRRMRRIYEQRRNELLAGLSRHCASSLEPIASDAGLHLAARLKSPVNLPALQRCLRETAPGARALQEYAQEPSLGDGIAFGFGQIDGGDMDLALHRLGRGLMRLR